MPISWDMCLLQLLEATKITLQTAAIIKAYAMTKTLGMNGITR